MSGNRLVQATYFLFRLVTDLLFFQAGSMKVLGWFGGISGQGTPAVLFCFIFPYMAAQGAGGWSLDALLRRKHKAPMAGEFPLANGCESAYHPC